MHSTMYYPCDSIHIYQITFIFVKGMGFCYMRYNCSEIKTFVTVIKLLILSITIIFIQYLMLFRINMNKNKLRKVMLY